MKPPRVAAALDVLRGLVAPLALALMTALPALAAPSAPPVPTGPVLDRIRQTGKIVIGHRESSVPFSYLDADKKPVGYAVELCLKLAEAVRKRLDLKAITPEYVLVTAGNRIPMVAEGKVDLECGSTTNNAERRQKVAFTIPHYITGARYMVLADSPIAELTNFEGKKLVSTKGTTPLKEVERANRERLLRITVLEAPEHSKAMQMVLAGEADGFAMDDVLLYGLIAENANKPGGPFVVVGDFLSYDPYGIMYRKGDAQLNKVVVDAFQVLAEDGEIERQYKRWFLRKLPSGTSLNLPMSAQLETIIQTMSVKAE